MYKILLLYPYFTQKTNQRVYSVEPLGLLSIATYFKREVNKNSYRIEIKIIDAQLDGSEKCIKVKRGYRSGLSNQEIENLLTKYQPNLVGITNNYTNLVHDVLELSRLIKKTCPSSMIVLGGAHATIDHHNLIKSKQIDAVARSEGEETFKEMVLSLYDNLGLERVLGLTYKKDGKIFINEDRPLIEDINTLPIPDRSLVNYQKYLEKSLNVFYNTMNRPVATLFTTRGCFFQCIFCSSHKVWRNKWRPRSAENMFKEVEYLKSTYGVGEIAFEDDQLMGNKDRIKKFCRLIIKKKLNMSFIAPAGISPALIDEETMTLMQRAGFYRLCFSIDVGTKSTQAYVKKPVQLEKMRDLVKQANSKGIWTYATFVLGFPDEKIKDIKETIEFAYSLKLDFLIFYLAQPHLGSELYDIYLKSGLIKEGNVSEHKRMNQSLFGTKYISSAKLEVLGSSAEQGYLKYHLRHFLNPAYILYEFTPKIFGLKKLAYFSKLVLSMVKIKKPKRNKAKNLVMRNILKEKNLAKLEGRTKYSLHFINQDDIASKEILDIGSGFGWFEREALALNVKKIIGLEVSKDNLAISRKYIFNKRVIFKRGTALSLPFPDKSFDTIVAWEVIEHLPKGKEKKMLQEIYRVLKDSGILYLSTPNKTFWANIFDPAWWLIGHRHYSKKKLYKYTNNISFEILDFKIKGRWWAIFSILNMYFSKWVLRRKPLFENFFCKKEINEYMGRNGFVNVFIKLKKK